YERAASPSFPQQATGVPRRLPALAPGGAFDGIPRGSDPVQIELPDEQILAAGFHHRIFHAQFAGEAGDRLPTRIGMDDIGLLMQLEKVELVVRKTDQLSPALPLQPEPAAFAHQPIAIARNIGALSTGVGNNAFQPMSVSHQPFPGGPSDRRRVDRLRGTNV